MADTEIKKKAKHSVLIKKEGKKTSGSSLGRDTYTFSVRSETNESSDITCVEYHTTQTSLTGVISRKGVFFPIENIPSAFIVDRAAQRELIKTGMPVDVFRVLKEWFALSEKDLAETLDISQRTLSRRKGTDKFNKSESEKVLRVLTLMKMAHDLFKDNEIVKDWFKSPNTALGGKTPLEYTDTEPGAREVEDLLGRLAHGVFS